MTESNGDQVSKTGWRRLNNLNEVELGLGSLTVDAVQSETTQNPESN